MKWKNWCETRDLVNWKLMDLKISSVFVSPKNPFILWHETKESVFVEISERSSVETRSALMWHSSNLLSWAIFHSWLYVYFKLLLPAFKNQSHSCCNTHILRSELKTIVTLRNRHCSQRPVHTQSTTIRRSSLWRFNLLW